MPPSPPSRRLAEPSRADRACSEPSAEPSAPPHSLLLLSLSPLSRPSGRGAVGGLRRRRRLLGAALRGALAAVLAAALVLPSGAVLPAAAAETQAGAEREARPEQPQREAVRNVHVDAAHVHWDQERGLRMDLVVGAHAVRPADDLFLDLQSQQHEGHDVSKLTVPDPSRGTDLSFLGKPGTVLWNAPQALYGNWKPVWPGVGAGDLPASSVDIDDVSIRLLSVDGPGWMEVFQAGGARVQRVFSSRDPKLQSFPVKPHAHGHFNWAFSKPGRYTVAFQARSRDPLTGKPVLSNVSKVIWQVGPPKGDEPSLEVGPESPRHRRPDGSAPSPRPSDPASRSSPESPTAPQPSQPASPSSPEKPAPSAPSPHGSCQRSVIASGHVDLAVEQAGGELKPVLVDESRGQAVRRAPQSAVLAVNDSLKTRIPRGFEAVGPEGSTAWIIPQVQEPRGIWAGFNTERLDYSRLAGPVSVSLASVRGPGRVTLFQEDLINGLTVRWDSAKRPHGAFALAEPSHVHHAMSFSRPGIYEMTVRYSARGKDGQVRTADAPYTVAVGSGTRLPAGSCAAGPVGTGGNGSGGSGVLGAAPSGGLSGGGPSGGLLPGGARLDGSVAGVPLSPAAQLASSVEPGGGALGGTAGGLSGAAGGMDEAAAPAAGAEDPAADGSVPGADSHSGQPLAGGRGPGVPTAVPASASAAVVGVLGAAGAAFVVALALWAAAIKRSQRSSHAPSSAE